jgi:hypothetical protein
MNRLTPVTAVDNGTGVPRDMTGMRDDRTRWALQTPEQLLDRIAELDACDSYIVLVVDPQTRESDAHGPYSGPVALCVADGFRHDFDGGGLADVEVSVTRLHPPSSDPGH